jgi:ribosomal protein S18 acetylase RimI-like enzyme
VREDYRLVAGATEVSDYMRLRGGTGLSPRSEAQASAAVTGAWYAVHVVTETTGEVVGMGRIIGDGGWYFHLVDVGVLPGHQRRGIGDWIVSDLLRHIRENARLGTFVSLFADPPGRRLYEPHGFVETVPGSVGMRLAK